MQLVQKTNTNQNIFSENFRGKLTNIFLLFIFIMLDVNYPFIVYLI